MPTRREESYDDFLYRLFKHTKEHTTRTVTIQVTDACNLACTYCYQINKKSHVISFDIAKQFIDNLLDGKYNEYNDYDNTEAIIFEFIGGEPFVAIDLISEITEYFVSQLIERNHHWQNRFRISICSNGTLYFEEKVQKYIQKYHHMLSFTISIDGNKKLHDACRVFPDGSGSYDIAMAAVNHYRTHYSSKDAIGSKMTISPFNVNYIFEAVQDIINNDYKSINLNCVYEEGWTVEHAKILYEQLKLIADFLFETNNYQDIELSIFDNSYFQPKLEEDNDNWCGGDGAMLAIDWKGDMYPCIRYMESSLGLDQEEMIIGTVQDGILVTEKQKNYFNCLKCITRRSQSTDECFYCPIAAGCSWCTAYNYQVFGTPDKRATYICIMHKARALANAYYWNKYYRITEPTKRFKIHIPKEWALEIIDEDEWKLLKFLESDIEL